MKHGFHQSASTVVSGALHIPVLLPQVSPRPTEWRSFPDKMQGSREDRIHLEVPREDRERIAGERHNRLFQGSLAASHQFGTTLNKPADPPAKRSLNRILGLIGEAINERRAALRPLRLPLMTSASLEQALSDMIGEFSPTGVRIQLVVMGQSRKLKPEVQKEVCLIAREALSNALRHSKATLIEVEIEYQRRSLRLIIRDDGRGMDSKAVFENCRSRGGLQEMQERAKIAGVGLCIWSGRGAGTEVEVAIPPSFVASAVA